MFRPLRAVMRSEAMRPPLLRIAAMQGKQRALLRTIAPRRGFASGRLVLNHSTNIDGLPTLLQKLLDHDDAITRIVPARIHATRAPARRAFELRITNEIPGGFKCLARAKSSVQEVFITTQLDGAALAAALDEVVPAGDKRRRRDAAPEPAPPPPPPVVREPTPAGPRRMRRWYTRRWPNEA